MWRLGLNLHLASMQGADHRVCKPADFFHIYACEWTPTEIRWYYDNHLVRIATNGISDFIYPMDVIVNAAIQEGSGVHPENSSYPNFFEVDYIRVYQR
ncbi:MAG TPA: glycoside hydrolase family 16 protein [Thermoanaerobaculia bacterium]|nr:glycoside hydrolase family 16 protein [Thermoanaerobaculia bacterium]